MVSSPARNVLVRNVEVLLKGHESIHIPVRLSQTVSRLLAVLVHHFVCKRCCPLPILCHWRWSVLVHPVTTFWWKLFTAIPPVPVESGKYYFCIFRKFGLETEYFSGLLFYLKLRQRRLGILSFYECSLYINSDIQTTTIETELTYSSLVTPDLM